MAFKRHADDSSPCSYPITERKEHFQGDSNFFVLHTKELHLLCLLHFGVHVYYVWLFFRHHQQQDHVDNVYGTARDDRSGLTVLYRALLATATVLYNLPSSACLFSSSIVESYVSRIHGMYVQRYSTVKHYTPLTLSSPFFSSAGTAP